MAKTKKIKQDYTQQIINANVNFETDIEKETIKFINERRKNNDAKEFKFDNEDDLNKIVKLFYHQCFIEGKTDNNEKYGTIGKAFDTYKYRCKEYSSIVFTTENNDVEKICEQITQRTSKDIYYDEMYPCVAIVIEKIDDIYHVAIVFAKKKSAAIIWLPILIIVLILSFGTSLFLLNMDNPDFPIALPSIMDPNGELEGNKDKTSEMEELLDKSKIAVSINSVPYFETPTSEGSLKIENVANQNKNIQVVIYLEDEIQNGIENAKPVYDTKQLMPPNSHIDSAKLDRTLKKGKYKAVAYFIGYDLETNEKVGQAAVSVTLYVGQTN